jgi:hypothetical protein
MKYFVMGAVLCTVLFVHTMHVSSDDEKPKSAEKSIEMKNLAAPSPQINQTHPQESSSDSDENQTEIKPFCFGNLNKKRVTLYSHIYTFASVDTNTQEKPK